MKNIIYTILLLMVISDVYASDMAKEARWKEQVVGDLFDGEPITLSDGKHDFLGLMIDNEQTPKQALIVLHGIGIHPDWPQVINPIRVQMAEKGWSTLSIQLPILDNEAEGSAYAPLIAEAAPRIQAAVDSLRKAGNNKIVIVAHSMGTRMSSYYLAQTSEHINAFIGIGMNGGTSQYLSDINLPLLDIYGSEDEVDGVISSASDRASASKNNAAYQQQVIEGADHFFNGMDDALITEITNWLNSY